MKLSELLRILDRQKKALGDIDVAICPGGREQHLENIKNIAFSNEVNTLVIFGQEENEDL